MKKTFRSRRWIGAFAIASLLACALPVRAATLEGLADLFNDGDSRLNGWIANPSEKMRFGDWDYVALETRGHDGAPANQHPVVLSPETLAAALREIRVASGKDVVPLFEEEEVSRLSRAISGGLAKASPAQDFVFVTTARHQVLGTFGQKLTSTGRVFFLDGELQLIVGIQLSDSLLGLRPGTRPTRALEPGERSRAAPGVKIVAPGKGARVLRNDWLAIAVPLGVAAQPQTASPASLPAVPALDPAVQRRFSEQETRLLLLKRLYDQGVISESEYQAKRAEALKQL